MAIDLQLLSYPAVFSGCEKASRNSWSDTADNRGALLGGGETLKRIFIGQWSPRSGFKTDHIFLLNWCRILLRDSTRRTAVSVGPSRQISGVTPPESSGGTAGAVVRT